jgi:RNA polymerase sigma-70 factor (ECF subfamily)
VTLTSELLLRQDPSEDDLVLATAQGDQRAFAQLYDMTSSRVLGLVRRILVDPAQSEEVAQEVFLSAWQEAAQFDPAKGRAVSWLLVRARRRAIDRVRSAQASRVRDMTVGIRDLDDVRDDVAETAAVHIEHARVSRAMKGLTAAQRQALELTYFGGLSHSEAAGEAGVPLGTMKTRTRDALIALRKLLGPDAVARG